MLVLIWAPLPPNTEDKLQHGAFSAERSERLSAALREGAAWCQGDKEGGRRYFSLWVCRARQPSALETFLRETLNDLHTRPWEQLLTVYLFASWMSLCRVLIIYHQILNSCLQFRFHAKKEHFFLQITGRMNNWQINVKKKKITNLIRLNVSKQSLITILFR